MIFQEDGVAVLVLAQRIVEQIHIEVAGERIRNDEWRRCQEIHAHECVYAAFEIAVPGQHAGADDVAFFHGGLDLGFQRARVADAGRAAVADGKETQRVEVVNQPDFSR